MNRYIKYGLLLAVVLLAGFNAVYFKRLSTMKNDAGKKFDAVVYTNTLWKDRLPARLEAAIALTALIDSVNARPEEALAKYSNAMSIGNYRYCIVKAEGIVTGVHPDDVSLQLESGDFSLGATLATEYIYGNAVRDASALVDIKDFSGNMDMNNISEELNRKVRSEVLPAFRSQVKKGDHVAVTGAIELNKAHIRFNGIEIIPVRIKIIP